MDIEANHDDDDSSDCSSNRYVSGVPVKPRDAEEFARLCDALRRNDPNVTSFSTLYLSSIAGGHGRDLGHALQRNTVVSKIELQLDYLIAREIKEPKHIAERTGMLLHWMEHSCSLRSVKIGTGDREVLTKEILLEPIMDALTKHGNIQSFDMETFRISVSLLTPFLQANTSLRELKIPTYAFGVDDSDDIYEESARAVGALQQLEVLSIATHQIDPILRQLPTSPAFNTTLRELALSRYEPHSQITLLCQVLSDRNCRLQQLKLQSLRLQARSWTLLSSALFRSNPSSWLRTLVLDNIEFSKKSALPVVLLRDMQSNPNGPLPQLQQTEQLEDHRPAPLHHIIDLRLTYCVFTAPRCAMKLGHMLCGSLLQHFTLDLDALQRRRGFYDVLTTQGATICLQSLRLLTAEEHDLRRLAPYIATTVHLRDLTVQLENIHVNVTLPTVFVLSLRSNGSLYKVHVYGDSYTPSDATVRRIRAYTTRNRVLSQSMATTSFGSNTTNHNHHGNDDGEPPSAAVLATTPARHSASAFPTLGVVAEHTPRMAPNNFLKTFLAASESLLPSQESSDEA